jgi:putative glutamine amidotransferase
MKRRPRIGLDLDFEHDGKRWVHKLPTAYVDTLIAAGAEPVLIPTGDPRPIPEILSELDGFLMTGGDDFHPHVLGREAEGLPMTLLTVRRENFVLPLARNLLGGNLPTMAICLGFQSLNVAAGGELYLDIPTEHEAAVDHHNGAIHRIDPEPGGLLDRCWGGESQSLMSHHHQGVRRLGSGLVAEARAEDGIVEAFGAPGHRFLLACQWHPEVQPDSPGGLVLIQRLVEAAASTS